MKSFKQFTNESEALSLNYGNYVQVNEYCGEFETSSNIVEVELHNVAKQTITNGTLLSPSYSTSTRIGTAYVKFVELDEHNNNPAQSIYNIYLFDVVMNSGQNFSNVKSIINYNSGVLGVADIIQTYNIIANSYVTQILDSNIINEKVFDYPNRSLRGRTVTYAFHVNLSPNLSEGLPRVKGGDDADKAFWMPVAEVLKREDEFFEDHQDIIKTMLGI